MALTLAATAVPLPPIPTTLVYAVTSRSVTGVPPTSDKLTQAMLGGGAVAALNFNAAKNDLEAKYGAGVYGIYQGYTISAGTGLNVNITAGQANVDGLVEDSAAAIKAVDDTIARIQIWLNADGTFTTVNNSLTEPAGHHAYLGSVVTSGGSVTSIDTAGVVYIRQGEAWRETADTGVPADSPGTSRRFWHKTASDLYYWGGTSYTLMSGIMTRKEAEASASGVVDGDVSFSTDGPFLERHNGSTLDQWGIVQKMVKPLPFSSWTNRGAAETVKAESGGGLYIEAPTAGVSTHAWCLYNIAAPATPFTVTMFLTNWLEDAAECANCVVLYEVATGKFIEIGIQRTSLTVQRYTNSSTFASTAIWRPAAGWGQGIWLRVGDNGTNITFEYSYDGINWDPTPLHSEARGSFFTTAPDEYGFGANSYNAAIPARVTCMSVQEA